MTAGRLFMPFLGNAVFPQQERPPKEGTCFMGKRLGQRRFETRTCQHCGAPFKALVYRPDKYCSTACSHVAIGLASRKEYPTRTCALCGKSFVHRRRDTSGKYCSRACSDSVKKNPPAQPWIKKICIHCGSPFDCPPWHPTVQHCSCKCARLREAETLRGPDHPLWKDKVRMKCEVCGEERLVKPSLASRFRACSRRCAAILSLIAQARTSKIEAAIAKALGDVGLYPARQYLAEGCLVDFAFPHERLAIECDGSYWHGRPSQQARDRKKDALLRSAGWRVIRLSEEEISASAADCVASIVKQLHLAQPGSGSAG